MRRPDTAYWVATSTSKSFSPSTTSVAWVELIAARIRATAACVSCGSSSGSTPESTRTDVASSPWKTTSTFSRAKTSGTSLPENVTTT